MTGPEQPQPDIHTDPQTTGDTADSPTDWAANAGWSDTNDDSNAPTTVVARDEVSSASEDLFTHAADAQAVPAADAGFAYSAPAPDAAATGAAAGVSATGSYLQSSQQHGFFGQSAPQVQIDPPASRVPHNLGGAVLGLVLTFGAVALAGVLTQQLLMGGPQSVPQKLGVLGLVLLAALPALLAGFAPATAWVPGSLLLLLTLIAMLSPGFATTLAEQSESLFGQAGAAGFLLTFGMPLGLALVFAGIGIGWARRSGAASVIQRIHGARI